MNLPGLFLADLPPEAVITPALVRDAAIAIKRNRARWLAQRKTQELAEMIAYTAERWLDPANSFRKLALTRGPAETGFGAATLARGLDGFFRSLTVENLNGLIAQDLGEGRRLDEFAAPMAELRAGRLALARGPELIAHIAAGTLPNSTLTSMVLGLLLKSAQFVKCGRGAVYIPWLFAHSLAELEPKMGGCLELANWAGGTPDLESALFAEADCITAQGSDETLEDLRRRVPGRSRFVGYGHKLSFGFVGMEMMSSYMARKIAERAAADVTAWNQMGCLSPHIFYVEDMGATSAEGFADLLATALAEREQAEPRGELSPEDAALIAGRRSLHELRAARHAAACDEAVTTPRGAFFETPNPATKVWASDGSTAWTVVFEADPRFHVSCLNRFVYVKPCRNLGEALHHADPQRGRVSTVGLGVTEGRAAELAVQLAHWGVPRVCPLGKMQEPPLGWRHDGRPALGELVTWTDFET
ncbi:MAG TPA: acyl-CoA reductase [Candidatus Limnocylindria bacterium]|nr:acyl-CoA reductase [Candidatus Limnocylindria bacterium]